jgi:hypothetical protein
MQGTILDFGTETNPAFDHDSETIKKFSAIQSHVETPVPPEPTKENFLRIRKKTRKTEKKIPREQERT